MGPLSALTIRPALGQCSPIQAPVEVCRKRAERRIAKTGIDEVNTRGSGYPRRQTLTPRRTDRPVCGGRSSQQSTQPSTEPSAFRLGSKLFPLLALKIVQLSVKGGFLAAKAFGYGAYAPMQAGILGKIEDGFTVGLASKRIAERFGDDRYRGSAIIVFEMFVRHWKEPLERCMEPLLEAYRYSITTGRVFEAAWALCYRQLWMTLNGAELADVQRQANQYASAWRSTSARTACRVSASSWSRTCSARRPTRLA